VKNACLPAQRDRQDHLFKTLAIQIGAFHIC